MDDLQQMIDLTDGGRPPARAGMTGPVRVPGVRALAPLRHDGAILAGRTEISGQPVLVTFLDGPHLSSWLAGSLDQQLPALLAISRHPNVVSVVDSGHTKSGRPFVITERHDYPSLATALRDHGPLAWEDALDLMATVAGAVGAAHEVGLLHRNIRPDQILVGPGMHVVVGGFGVLGTVAGLLEPPAGPAVFESPEVRAGRTPTVASDVYGMAATTFALLTGDGPAGRLGGPLRESGTPEAVVRVLLAGLAKDPKRRPARVVRLIERLDLAAAQPVHTTPAATPSRRADDLEEEAALIAEGERQLQAIVAGIDRTRAVVELDGQAEIEVEPQEHEQDEDDVVIDLTVNRRSIVPIEVRNEAWFDAEDPRGGDPDLDGEDADDLIEPEPATRAPLPWRRVAFGVGAVALIVFASTHLSLGSDGLVDVHTTLPPAAPAASSTPTSSATVTTGLPSAPLTTVGAGTVAAATVTTEPWSSLVRPRYSRSGTGPSQPDLVAPSDVGPLTDSAVSISLVPVTAPAGTGDVAGPSTSSETHPTPSTAASGPGVGPAAPGLAGPVTDPAAAPPATTAAPAPPATTPSTAPSTAVTTPVTDPPTAPPTDPPTTPATTPPTDPPSSPPGT